VLYRKGFNNLIGLKQKKSDNKTSPAFFKRLAKHYLENIQGKMGRGKKGM